MEGSGSIDRAPLTGEPIPAPVKKGDRVEAGLTLTRGPLVIKSEAIGQGTRLSSLIDLVRHYKDQPTRTQSTIERFTLLWTPLVSLSFGNWLVNSSWIDRTSHSYNSFIVGSILSMFTPTFACSTRSSSNLSIIVWNYRERWRYSRICSRCTISSTG